MPTPSPNSGTMDISYVVAAVRGSAMTMPVHRMTAVFSTKPGTRPIDPSTAAFAPPAALSAKMPRHESTTSISTKHRKPSTHSVPLSMPRYGGNIKFPAPKNMANSANPVISVSFFTTSPSTAHNMPKANSA